MQITKDMTGNNATSGRVSYSGPMMKNRNAAARIPSSRAQCGSRVDTIASDQRVMDQQKKNLRAFNRTDTMDTSKRQIKIPNDPSWVS